MIVRVVDFLAQVIGMFGVGIILWGVGTSFLRFLDAERKYITDQALPGEREKLRQGLGFYILLGLEFLIAADMIRTISRPSLQEVAVLAGIVLIRTVINFSLNREVSFDSRRKKA